MITHYGGYPGFDVMYDTGGHIVDAASENEAVAYFTAGGDGQSITDVFVFAHGWNNDEADARNSLYTPFFRSFRTILPLAPELRNRTFGVVALFWPSKRFADADLIPGGAASATSSADTRLAAQLDRLDEVFASDPTAAARIAHARTLVPKLDLSPTAQDDFVATLLALTPKPRYEADEGLDDARIALETIAGRDVLQRLSIPFVPVVPIKEGTGSAASFGGSGTISIDGLAPGTGSAAGWIGNLSGGIKNAAADLGNVLTYYTMKDRAGIVGRTGAVSTVRRLLAAGARNSSRRYHLIGHSFGGRLVTSLANALAGGEAETLETLTLLEAAYSHNGLSPDYDGRRVPGSFRSVVATRKAKRILITHSAHDVAVGVAYPLASRMMNQAADALFGGPSDKFGGMGRNGAQRTPEAFDDTLHPLQTGYGVLDPTKCIRNLNGDGPAEPVISGHGDVTKPEIAWAVAMNL